MIIIRMAGGLGNQMFQYALGRRLAYKHRTSLKLDLTWFQTQTLRSYQLDTLKISAEIASSEATEKLTRTNWGGLKGSVYRAVQRRLPYYRQRIVREQTPLFDPRIVKNVPRNSYLVGYWQSENYFTPIAPLLRQEFTLKESLSPEGQVWREKISNQLSVSLHVRRGDYIYHPQTNRRGTHGVCSQSYYAEAIHYIRSIYPDATIFVFSDDIEWARQNLVHNAPIEFVEIKEKNRDQEELELMSLCDHHIIANSSYSWWGAWLGTYPEKIVIAPQNWFNDLSRNTIDLIPDTWIRL